MKILPIRPKHIQYIPRNPEPFIKPGSNYITYPVIKFSLFTTAFGYLDFLRGFHLGIQTLDCSIFEKSGLIIASCVDAFGLDTCSSSANICLKELWGEEHMARRLRRRLVRSP